MAYQRKEIILLNFLIIGCLQLKFPSITLKFKQTTSGIIIKTEKLFWIFAISSFCSQKPKSMVWQGQHDLLLLREILAQEPWKFKEGSVEKGKCWDLTAETLNTLKDTGFRVDKRFARDRFGLLRSKYDKKINDEEKASGISPEQVEVDDAMCDILKRSEEAEEEHQKEQEEKKEGEKRRRKKRRQKMYSKHRTWEELRWND